MGKYALRRILEALPLLLVISVVLFIIMNSIGDPLAIQISEQAPPTGEQQLRLRRQMGLDQPIIMQYIYWMVGNDWTRIDADGDGTTSENVYGHRTGILRGDLGVSLVTRQPVLQRIGERLPNTLLLMIPAYLLTILIAGSLGVFSALRQYSWLDNLLTALTYVFRSMPIFFISLALIFIFAIGFRRLGLPHPPISGMYGPGMERTVPNLIVSMILPVLSLVLVSSAGYMRYVRASVLEIMNRDFVRTARSKGISEQRVFGLHVLKNAALPLVTIIGLDLPFLLAGAVLVESVFSWPGMGLLFVESMGSSDYPVLMAMLMLVAVAVVGFQLITDLLYSVLDPRVSLG
jgi:peptide/nickel transport system permease protein